MAVIKVENLTKIYKLYDKNTDRLKEALHPFHKKYHKEFYALKNVSFEVKKGQMLGIIGKNGSGKSTLLKIITGVLSASAGSVKTNGKISSLLELGTGFNPEYTGIENIYFNGMIMGFTKEEMDKKLSEIIEFADIGDFLYQPVKTYSSGMFVRLAFALSINVDPDILIVDEALSVGDIRFQQKCFRKIDEIKKTKTVILVTHDIGAVNKFCDNVIWINEGKIVDSGDAYRISKLYQAFMVQSKLSKSKRTDKIKENYTDDKKYKLDRVDKELDIFGDGKAQIIEIGMFDAVTDDKLEDLSARVNVKLFIRVKYNEEIMGPIVGFTLKDRLGNTILQTNSYILNEPLEDVIENQIETYSFEFIVPNLNDGTYSISPAIASGIQENHIQHNWIHDAIVFNIINSNLYSLQGVIFLDGVKFDKE